MQQIRERLKFLLSKGLFHIFGTSIINNIIQFLTNILVVNLVSKYEYGVYTYANNIISFFLLVRGMGLCSGLIQFACEQTNEKRQQEIYKYVLIRGNQFNLGLTVILAIGAMVINFKLKDARIYILAMLFVPILQWMFDYVTSVFRVKQNNIMYARITNINTIFYFFFSVIGAKCFDVFGIIVGRYLSFIISICVASYILRKDIKGMEQFRPRKYEDRGEIVKYSAVACLSNSLSELLYLLDVFLIGVFIADPNRIAAYKVATQIPTALAFIPLGVVTFIYPYFAQHNKDMVWVKKNLAALLKVLTIINGVICIGLLVLAPLIIKILWGEEYLDALLPFRILALNYFLLGTFRIPCGNILAMLRKVKVNFVISVVSSAANVILDIVLIKYFGSVGAALATLLVVLISSGIAFPYLITYINTNLKVED